MRQINFILTGVIFLFAACHHGDHTPSIKREIPTYIGGTVDAFYQSAKERQQQLGLDSLENGFHDLQVRVWYNAALERGNKFIVITNKDSNWTATVYNLQVKRDGQTETIISKEIKQVVPKSGWPVFSKKLMDLQIKTLPNQDDVEGYSAGDDGSTYSVEVATKDQYRFYSYWEPQRYQDRIWQAKNMSEILRLFETELGI